jgi:hypothetical protein
MNVMGGVIEKEIEASSLSSTAYLSSLVATTECHVVTLGDEGKRVCIRMCVRVCMYVFMCMYVRVYH